MNIEGRILNELNHYVLYDTSHKCSLLSFWVLFFFFCTPQYIIGNEYGLIGKNLSSVNMGRFMHAWIKFTWSSLSGLWETYLRLLDNSLILFQPISGVFAPSYCFLSLHILNTVATLYVSAFRDPYPILSAPDRFPFCSVGQNTSQSTVPLPVVPNPVTFLVWRIPPSLSNKIFQVNSFKELAPIIDFPLC